MGACAFSPPSRGDAPVVSHVAGSSFPGDAEGVGTVARFSYPRGIAYQFDANTNAGRLFVADHSNCRIRTIDLSSGLPLGRSVYLISDVGPCE
jgi:hypothetical protein